MPKFLMGKNWNPWLYEPQPVSPMGSDQVPWAPPKVAEKVLFTMDRVHTQLHNNQTAGGESGEQSGVIWSGDPVYLQDIESYILRHP